MEMTATRWITGCVLGCLTIAVLLLPPQPQEDPFYRWTPRWSAREQGLTTRVQNRRMHGNLLWRAYQGARDVDVAQREFGAKTTGSTAAPGASIWFDSDIPPATRREVSQVLSGEVSAHGAWRDKSRTGVLVFTDTVTALDGNRLPWGYNSGLIASTTVLLPTRETGDRCVTVIRIGHLALIGGGTIPPDRGLLDGCAFYDAFGKPGPQIAAWMDSSKAGYARTLSFSPPDSATSKRTRWGYEDYYFGDEAFARCAANDLSACSVMLREPMTRFYWRYWPDASVPAPVEAQENDRSARGFNATLVDAMVRDIGPERFERVWQSPKSLDSAYFDATGEPLAAWVHRRVVTFDGPYHIGPLPTATSAILTILTILISLALSARFARRPAAA
jgi:hypothetical protein